MILKIHHFFLPGKTFMINPVISTALVWEIWLQSAACYFWLLCWII